MNICIYHDHCADGYMSAAIFYMHFRAIRETIHFIPAQYGDEAPTLSERSNVYILDFSYPRAQLEKMKSQVKSLVVLDHHKTAQAALEGLSYCIFDMEKSGARLTWEYFNPNHPAPKLVSYVEDRDLWKWKLPQSREVSAGLTLLEKIPEEEHFETWLHYLDRPEELIEIGKVVLKLNERYVKLMAGRAHFQTFAGYYVPVVNSTHLHSEVGEFLAPGKPFAVIYKDIDGKRIFNLRSTHSGIDVGKLAKKYGGGGHREAAAFTWPLSKLWMLKIGFLLERWI